MRRIPVLLASSMFVTAMTPIASVAQARSSTGPIIHSAGPVYEISAPEFATPPVPRRLT